MQETTRRKFGKSLDFPPTFRIFLRVVLLHVVLLSISQKNIEKRTEQFTPHRLISK
jgi:hypothetical protein